MSTQTGTPARTQVFPLLDLQPGCDLRWSPDGTVVAAASDGPMLLGWDVSRGSQVIIQTGHGDLISDAAWSPNGTHLATLSRDALYLTDARAGHLEARMEAPPGAEFSRFAWSPCGTRVAIISRLFPTIRQTGRDRPVVGRMSVQVWESAQDQEGPALTLGAEKKTRGLRAISWSADGRRIAAACADHSVLLWDARTGSALAPYRGHTGPVDAATFAPTRSACLLIASASFDGSVRVWQADTGEEVFVYRGRSRVRRTVAWSPDGARLAFSSDDPNSVTVASVSTGRTLLTYDGHASRVQAIGYAPDGSKVASVSTDALLHVWPAYV